MRLALIAKALQHWDSYPGLPDSEFHLLLHHHTKERDRTAGSSTESDATAVGQRQST